MQLIRALQQAGKSFEVQVGPDAGHSNVANPRMMEFFIENLVLRPERLIAPAGQVGPSLLPYLRRASTTTAPSFMTQRTPVNKASIFSSGLPSTAMMSAR